MKKILLFAITPFILLLSCSTYQQTASNDYQTIDSSYYYNSNYNYNIYPYQNNWSVGVMYNWYFPYYYTYNPYWYNSFWYHNNYQTYHHRKYNQIYRYQRNYYSQPHYQQPRYQPHYQQPRYISSPSFHGRKY